MSGSVKLRVAAAGALLAVAGCTGSDAGGPAAVNHPVPDSDGFAGAGLPDPYPMPAVELVDTSGEPFHLVSDTTEPVTLMFFGYTHCPDVCNLVLADLASAMTRLDPAVRDDVQMVFVTTDPARDDPQTIRAYLDRFDPEFEGLTGPMRRVEAVARPLGVLIEGTRRLPGGGYEVGHGSQVLGFGPDDTARVVWTQGTPVGDYVADVTRLVQRAT